MCKKSTVISFVKVFESLFLKADRQDNHKPQTFGHYWLQPAFIDIFIKSNIISLVSVLKKKKVVISDMFFLQISKLQYPVSYLSGTFVPSKGWFIFGGNNGFNQTQRLQTIDAAWTIGDPIFYYDFNFCTVQVMT